MITGKVGTHDSTSVSCVPFMIFLQHTRGSTRNWHQDMERKQALPGIQIRCAMGG